MSRLRRPSSLFGLLVLGVLAAGSAGAQFGVDLDDLGLPVGVDAPVEGPTDPRFFGTYCADRVEDLCKQLQVRVLGVPVGSRELCADVRDVRVDIAYHESTGMFIQGHLEGGGPVTIEGVPTVVAVAGPVVATGRARVAGAIPGVGRLDGTARLSADALEVELLVQGERISLRKDACGNRPPRVRLLSPAEGATFAPGETVILHGTATDAEDDAFPPDRMRFHSHRDGQLQGDATAGPGSLVLETSTLSLGQHAITFLATDSGGLEDGRTVTITVGEHPTIDDHPGGGMDLE